MGRLPSLTIGRAAALVLLALATLAACETDRKKSALTNVPRERSEVVQATGPTAPAPSAPASAAKPIRSSAGRKLCEGQTAKPGRDMPKKPPSRKAAPGAQAPLALTAGRWTWINLWAAWCAPCKEEMPRLRGFAARLAQAGKEPSLVFVSLDDDERQLEQFLAAQPEGGMRATFWLREGRERDEWLGAVGLAADSGLPAQLLVDPRGKIRCAVSGAVEDQDYAEIAAIVSQP